MREKRGQTDIKQSMNNPGKVYSHSSITLSPLNMLEFEEGEKAQRCRSLQTNESLTNWPYPQAMLSKVQFSLYPHADASTVLSIIFAGADR